MRAILFLILFTIYYLLFTITKANAQGISLGVYPPIFRIDSTPPAIIQAPVAVENLGDSSLNLTIDFKPFTASDREDGQVQYITDEEANLANPLFFSRGAGSRFAGQRVKIFDPSVSSEQTITSLSLAPKQKKELTVRIDLPKEEPAADYYFSIIFLASDTSGTFDTLNSSRALSGIASNILLSIGPKGKTKGEIQEFSSPLFMEKGPVPFIVRVKNTGSHFINPKGDILIKNIFGQTVGRVDLLPVNILANSVRGIPASPDESLGEPSLEGDQTAAYWNEKFALGIYNAKLTLALSDQGPILTKDVLFFAFPAKILIAALIGGIILIYIALRVRRRL